VIPHDRLMGSLAGRWLGAPGVREAHVMTRPRHDREPSVAHGNVLVVRLRTGERMRGIAVIDRPAEDRVAIWHVSVGDGLESNMAGAWVLPVDDHRNAGLLTGRLPVMTADAAALLGSGADVAVLARAIEKEIADLDATFSAYVQSLPTSRRNLVRPRWPRIPMEPRREAAGDPLASGALTVARWVSDLLTAWARVEKERLARPFLVSTRGAETRDFPPGWPADETEEAAA
jgi:hypothetical protein